MRTLVIVNPHAGDGGEDLSRVASLIRHHPAMGDPDIRITGATDDACLMAAVGVRRGFRRIFSVGGDGTLNEVLNGIMHGDEDGRRGVRLGVLPLGTGNDFARTLGLPLDLEEALDAVDSLEARPVDVVRVTGSLERHFINASAGGFSGRVDEQVTRERKRDWGPLAYLRGALDLLPDPEAYRTRLVLGDGREVTVDALNVAVANGRTVAGGVPVAPTARLDDGLLDVVVVRKASLSRLAAFGSRCVVGKHLDHELCEHLRTREVAVRAEPEMPFNLDGEPIGRTPLDYRVLPGAVHVLASADAPGFGAGEGEEEGDGVEG